MRPAGRFNIAYICTYVAVARLSRVSYPFALESISKVFSMALVMEAVGAQEMLKKVGADPTGLPFNSVMALELHRGKPLSPLVNAGAMATVSLLPAANSDEKWQKILDGYSQFAGHTLEVMNAVYTSCLLYTSSPAVSESTCVNTVPSPCPIQEAPACISTCPSFTRSRQRPQSGRPTPTPAFFIAQPMPCLLYTSIFQSKRSAFRSLW